MVIGHNNVCANFNYDRLHIDKVLGNLKHDNNKNKHKNKNNVRSAWGPFRVQKLALVFHEVGG